MNSRMGRRAGVVVVLAVALSTLFVASAAPSGAATKNACKVLTKREIQTAFGGTVSSPKKGISTPVSAQCEYTITANGDRPSGTVIVHLMTTGAKAAYDGLKKQVTLNEPIDGVPNSLYSEKLHVVNVLKGNVFLGVQGGFTIIDPLPIHFYDDKAQLTALAQIGVKRV